MASPDEQWLRWLDDRAGQPWLCGPGGEDWAAVLAGRSHDRTQQLRQQLKQQPNQQLLPQEDRGARPLRILLAELDPVEFLAGLMAGIATGSRVFLANPAWSAREWQRAIALVRPQVIWAERGDAYPTGSEGLFVGEDRQDAYPPESQGGALGDWQVSGEFESLDAQFCQALIAIPTGGTSGKLRFVVHSWESLETAAIGFGEFFAAEFLPFDSGVNPRLAGLRFESVCSLPLFHVSGLMQFVRCWVLGGKLQVVSPKTLGQHLQAIPATLPRFLSLVPTQLARLLEDAGAIAALQTVRVIFLGGAPAGLALLDRARHLQIRLAPTYGLSETAAQVATLLPSEFLAGQGGCGRILPHATVKIWGAAGEELPRGEVGRVAIGGRIGGLRSPRFWGYWQAAPLSEIVPDESLWLSDDLGYFDAGGSLHLVGRASDTIITGGENVFPAEVEAAILATGWVEDVCVVGVGDRLWGQRVAAAVVAQSGEEREGLGDRLKLALKSHLSPYKIPKSWCVVDRLPRNGVGKLERSRVLGLFTGSYRYTQSG